MEACRLGDTSSESCEVFVLLYQTIHARSELALRRMERIVVSPIAGFPFLTISGHEPGISKSTPMRNFLPFFQLCRVPAVFSAIADIASGYALTHPDLTREPFDWHLVTLIMASCCLYLSGMAFNDIFDRNVDLIERPQRPIPSGRVALRSAINLAVILMVCGNLLALLTSATTGCIALLLSACILAYNGGMKQTVAGPLFMGGCRFLNVLLGASSVGGIVSLFGWPQVALAGCMGLYITGVTIFSRQEAGVSSRGILAMATLVVNLGLASLLVFLWYLPDATLLDGLGKIRLPVIGLLTILITIDRRILGALLTPSGPRVQSTVRTMLMSLISLNAVVAFQVTGDPLMLIVVGGMLIPALFLGRYMSIT